MGEQHRNPTGPPLGVDGGSNDSAEIAPWLLSLLVCPVDHGEVYVDGLVLVCQRCGRRYPIRDGIPVMMPGEAEEEQKF